ncbi:MAG TPA: hypothetical protein VK633_06710, partial [Verrucomicrobiae bacterium]|nr:hypothetical protein [Verrucomicrobiae bacterium]
MRVVAKEFILRPWVLVAWLAVFSSGSVLGELVAKDWAVQITAMMSGSPPQIHLNWPGDVYAQGYTVFRKHRHDRSWTFLTELPGAATSFHDSDISPGTGYEYKIVKLSTGGQESWTYTGYGYIYAGGQLPLVESRGRVILITEASIEQPLETELKQFEYDLIADGWSVARASVRTTDSVISVKDRIQSIYSQDPSTTR